MAVLGKGGVPVMGLAIFPGARAHSPMDAQDWRMIGSIRCMYIHILRNVWLCIHTHTPLLCVFVAALCVCFENPVFCFGASKSVVAGRCSVRRNDWCLFILKGRYFFRCSPKPSFATGPKSGVRFILIFTFFAICILVDPSCRF